MDPITENPVIQLLGRHRSVRRYTDAPIPAAMLEAVIRAGQGAASSSFIQAYSVVRVTNTAARSALASAAGNQPWIEQAAEFLVLCADLRRVDAACRQSDAGPLAGWTEHGLAAVVDTALMAQGCLVAAESLGSGGVFIGGLRNAGCRWRTSGHGPGVVSLAARQVQGADPIIPVFSPVAPGAPIPR